MNRRALVFLTALACGCVVSHAYTAARYTDATCANLYPGTSVQTSATNGCSSPGNGTSLNLPNNNCPIVGGFWVSTYNVPLCAGTPAATTWFGSTTGGGTWSSTGSGACTTVGTNFYKVTCSLTDNTTTTTEMKFGLPWWFWLLLYLLCCCCCALCGGGGAIPFLGGKKKPTKKPAPVATPSVVEEVITVEDEAAPMVTSGYPTASMAVPMASAAVPMASTTVPMTGGYGAGYGAYPTATMAY